jgi:hypothetical protein
MRGFILFLESLSKEGRLAEWNSGKPTPSDLKDKKWQIRKPPVPQGKRRVTALQLYEAG